MSQLLKRNEERVAHESIENEIIVIDLESGAYYNLTGAAADIWNLLEQQPTTDQLSAALAEGYDCAQPEIAAEIQPFIDDLAANDLIFIEDASPDIEGPILGLPETDKPFVAPALTKFTNMADLLLLDPIHDVNDKGWPNTSHTQ